MKHVSVLIGMMLVFLVGVVACESKPAGEAEKVEKAKEEPAAAETALLSPEGSPGRMENDEGVDHYGQGHYDVAEVHFRKSLTADPKLAVAHFNLALALDKLAKHKEATEHFKKAAELAPDDPQIAESKILKAHTGM